MAPSCITLCRRERSSLGRTELRSGSFLTTGRKEGKREVNCGWVRTAFAVVDIMLSWSRLSLKCAAKTSRKGGQAELGVKTCLSRRNRFQRLRLRQTKAIEPNGSHFTF